MFNKKIVLIVVLMATTIFVKAQDCNLTLTGYILDEVSGLPLSFVNVFMQESAIGTITDDKGKFLIKDVCAGEYHFTVSHIGCEPKYLHVEFSQDTVIKINLHHSVTSLETVMVEGKKEISNNQPSTSINRKLIEDNTNENLSNILENSVGVSVLKNGTGISKPVIHGLYGNRVLILNNGILQSGQQWGNDHSPEIDPNAADKITIIKGANAIEYGGGNLGSIVLVEPKRIEEQPHLHGQVNYAFETNGQGHNFNFRLGKYSPMLSWRINGTLKKYGDRNTPDYFLNNTGTEEANLSIQLEKKWKDKLFTDLYLSTFNTRLGVLRGSHIGNLTDLEQALVSDTPFFTEADFSYDIDAPKQEVGHHLVKFKTKYLIDNNQILTFVAAAQLNNRKEFDVRRGGRTTIPSLSLSQFTFNTEFKYDRNFDSDWHFKIGNQTISTSNENDAETGILPLIPNYWSIKNGTFSTLSKEFQNIYIKFGVRYDFEQQRVAKISNSIPREILRYKNDFHNFSGLFTATYKLSINQTISLNSGYAMRNPAINELYSFGLHQGVSGIEEGNEDLQTEKAWKNTIEYEWLPSTNFSLKTLFYHQHFQDYIFLNPQDEFRLTIRGAFPVFHYEQTDANIYGLDISTQFTMNQSFYGVLRYSYLKGNDISNNIPLVFMPPNSFYSSITYRAKNPVQLSNALTIEEPEIEINNRLVFQQNNILEEQDFATPPPTYNLLGLKASANIVFSEYKIRAFVKADNLLNVRYRDYLNRQRYFADDLGLSITAGVNFKF